MNRWLLLVGQAALLIAASTLSSASAWAQGAGQPYPYWDPVPATYETPDTHITPGQASHVPSALDPDHSYYYDDSGFGMFGGFLPWVSLSPEKPDTAAHLWVRVPANAQLWVDGVKTKEKGESRYFFSPPLVPGKKYTYDLRVRWMKDGKPVERERLIAVHAGSRIDLDFTRPHVEHTSPIAKPAESHLRTAPK